MYNCCKICIPYLSQNHCTMLALNVAVSTNVICSNKMSVNIWANSMRYMTAALLFIAFFKL